MNAALLALFMQATGFNQSGQDLFIPRERPELDASGYARTRADNIRVDMRARADVAAYAPIVPVAVKARFDVLDTRVDTLPRDPPRDPIKTRRAWGEVLLPFGLLAAGRMGTHWGLGMLANGGDCLDCDSVDSADRVLFVAPFAGHLWAGAWDFASNDERTPVPRARTLTFAASRWYGDESRERCRAAGKTTVEYGAFGARQDQRESGFHSVIVDGWVGVTFPWARIAVEAAWIDARFDRLELAPGILFRRPVVARQIGAAVETEIGAPDGVFGAGVDGGHAGGDGFRFHSDYRIDRILFRELAGTVSDAAYVRPHARVRFVKTDAVDLSLTTAVVASADVRTHAWLGLEVDPSLTFSFRAFVAALDYGALFLRAKVDDDPVQLVRLRLAIGF